MHAYTYNSPNDDWHTGYVSPPSGPGRYGSAAGSPAASVRGGGGGGSGGHIDLDQVLDRAMHRSSLQHSEEKLLRHCQERGFERGVSATSTNSHKNSGGFGSSSEGAGLYSSPPRSTAAVAAVAAAAAATHGTKSPFRLTVDEHGREQLQPGSGYWKERLSVRRTLGAGTSSAPPGRPSPALSSPASVSPYAASQRFYGVLAAASTPLY
jgi:hypothetical protein